MISQLLLAILDATFIIPLDLDLIRGNLFPLHFTARKNYHTNAFTVLAKIDFVVIFSAENERKIDFHG
jgi:hypothetical protein